MNWTERRERFRAILSGNRCVHPGSDGAAVFATRRASPVPHGGSWLLSRPRLASCAWSGVDAADG